MANIAPKIRNSLQTGLITESAVSDNDYPQDAVTESINLHFDTLGRATLRKGITAVGNNLSGNVLGLYQFLDSGAGTNNKLIVVVGTTAYYLNGSTWTAKRTGLTSGSKARFSTFLDYVFMVNGTEATQTWDGSASAFGTTNAVSAPTGKFIENFRARMWIAGNTTYPDRLYYSTLPSAVSTPLVSWDTSATTGQWIDISPSDGENVTALHRTKSALLVFKNNHIYQVYSISQVDPDPKFNVGTYCSESIVETKNGVYFHHPTGFYRYNGDVAEISRAIIDIVGGISLTNYSKVAGWLEKDGDHVCWAIGDVTYGGITYSNMVVRYSISSQTWTHYVYPTQALVGATYNDDSNLYAITGDESGNVYLMETGNTDAGAEISYSLVYAWDNLDGSESTRKNINSINFLGKANGTNISYQADDEVVNNWKPIGQMGTGNKGFNSISLKGKKIRFRESGNSKGEPIRLEGYEVLDSSSEMITFT